MRKMDRSLSLSTDDDVNMPRIARLHDCMIP